MPYTLPTIPAALLAELTAAGLNVAPWMVGTYGDDTLRLFQYGSTDEVLITRSPSTRRPLFVRFVQSSRFEEGYIPVSCTTTTAADAATIINAQPPVPTASAA